MSAVVHSLVVPVASGVGFPCHACEAVVGCDVVSEPEIWTDDIDANGADSACRNEVGSTTDPKATS